MRYANCILLSVLFFIIPTAGFAGSLNDPGGPNDPDSAMYTVTDVYNRINDGTAGTKRTTPFGEPSAAPGPTGKTLDDLYSIASERSRPAKTGQTPTVPLNPALAGSDGALQKGVPWPSPRFANNSNGTVTDNLTGLIWLQNANKWGAVNWDTARNNCNNLAADGSTLTDGSVAGDWRLPNVMELLSLIAWGYYDPALTNAAGTAKWTTSGDAFTGVQSNGYWSSTTNANDTSLAWAVNLISGNVDNGVKTLTIYVWPVRGGQ